MALVTANQFQLTPNLSGAVGAGINAFQQAQAGQRQQQQLGINQKQADRQALQDRFTSVANAAATAKNLPDDASKINFLTNRVAELNKQGIDSSDTQQALDLFNSGQSEQANALINSAVQTGIDTGILKSPTGQTPGAGQFTLGNKRFDAQGNVVAEGAAVPVKLSSVQQKVAAEGIDPNSPAGFARAREITQGSRTDPSLKPSEQQVLSKASEGQLASAGFANRVGAANKALTDLENIEGFDPTAISSAVLGNIPLGNIAQSTEQQQFLQAKRDWITAVLRKESGAAIGKDEFENEDNKFFPQIGDKPEVLERKRQGRERAFENLKKQSKGVFDVQFKEERDLTTLSDDDLLDF